MSRFNRDRALQVLVTAYKHNHDGRGDQFAAKFHGLDRRTVRNYRARLERDPELSQAWKAKKALIDADRDTRDVEDDRAVAQLKRDGERLLLEALNEGYRFVANAFKGDLAPEDASKLLHVLQGGKKLAAEDALAHKVVGDLVDAEPEGENVIPIRKTN